MKLLANLCRHCSWINLPGAILVALLQRTPALNIGVTIEEMVVSSPTGAMLKSIVASVAALGAVNSMAGATPLVPSMGSATGISVAMGSAVSVFYTVNGTQTPPASWKVTGTFPPGLDFSGLTGSGSVNVGPLHLEGTPSAAGTYPLSIQTFEFTGTGGVGSPIYSYTITVTGPAATAPSFTTQPGSQTVTTGGSVTFTAAASGSPAPTYQWQVSTSGGSTWANLANAAPYGGAATGTLMITGATVSMSGNQYRCVASNGANPNATTNAVTLTVNKAVSAVTWAVPAAITYGTALSSAQLDATASVPGTLVYTPVVGTVLKAGQQTLSVKFTPTDATDYTTATATLRLTVNKAVSAVTWAVPAAITYGTALSSAQLDATASVPGTLVYTPVVGTVLKAGQQTLSVKFTPTDATDYTTATATLRLTVNKAVPAVTWAVPAAITYGTALSATQLDATASVPGTLVYTPVVGTVLTGGIHPLGVKFTPTDATDYTTVVAIQHLRVNKAVPAIKWAAPAAITYPTPLSSAQLDATSSVAGTFVYTPPAGTVLQPGLQTLSVKLTPTDTTDYTSPTVTRSLTVNAKVATALMQQTPVTTPLAIRVLAGQALSSGSSDGMGNAARFSYPSGIAADNSGNLYLADTDNHTIRKIVASTGTVTTLAGLAGNSGSTDGAGSDARFDNPSGVAVDGAGNVYVADTMNNTLRVVSPLGVVSTLAGSPGTAGSTDGTGSSALFQGPQGLAIDTEGNLYVADTNNHTIRKVVLSTGVVTTVAGLAGNAGSSDGPGSQARFNYPSGVAVDGSGNLDVADTDNHTIRAISPSGQVSTLAGLAGSPGGADGAGRAARFNSPSDLAVDSSGNIYVADTDNFTIREVIPSTGVAITLAGVAETSGSTDGLGSAVRFFHPAGIAVDSDSNLYIADTDNDTIRVGSLAVAPAIQTQPQSQMVHFSGGGGGGMSGSGGAMSGSGGGGAPSTWFCGALVLLAAARMRQARAEAKTHAPSETI